MSLSAQLPPWGWVGRGLSWGGGESVGTPTAKPHALAGVELLEKAPSPRLVKTHLPVQLLPKSFCDKNCKVTLQVLPTSLPTRVAGRRYSSAYPNHVLCCPQVIYMARNPKDVVVSYYYFYQMAKTHPDPGTLAEFLETFMAGKGGG